MRTTLDLPDALMREVKIRAAQQDRKLKEVVEELIRAGLGPGFQADLSDASKPSRSKERRVRASVRTPTAKTTRSKGEKAGDTSSGVRAAKAKSHAPKASKAEPVDSESDAFVDSQFPL